MVWESNSNFAYYICIIVTGGPLTMLQIGRHREEPAFRRLEIQTRKGGPAWTRAWWYFSLPCATSQERKRREEELLLEEKRKATRKKEKTASAAWQRWEMTRLTTGFAAWWFCWHHFLFKKNGNLTDIQMVWNVVKPPRHLFNLFFGFWWTYHWCAHFKHFQWSSLQINL